MIVTNNATGKHQKLLSKLVDELRRALPLLELLSDEIYCETKGITGSIGSHFRHNLDFVNSFLSGLEKEIIDYNKRRRDPRIERETHYASKNFSLLIEKLENLGDEVFEKAVMVRSEVDESNWYRSSGLRELEFVHSHTVHHYAFIAEKLKTNGFEIPADFGVAPSTLNYWASHQKKTKAAKAE